MNKPDFFILHWNITGRCNLQCKHCCQENSYLKNELVIRDLLKILDQYIYFLRFYNIKGYIALSGGEPFLRKDFFNLLEKISQYKNLLKFGILTNGLFITKENAQRLRNLGVDFIQLSLDGMEKTNDSIRGKGTFKKIVRAAEILVKSKVPVGISFTAFKLNYKEFPEVVELAKKLRVNNISASLLAPLGKASKIKNLMLNSSELKIYSRMVNNLSKSLKKEKSHIHIYPRKVLYPLLKGEEQKFICPVAKNIITIMPNGEVRPCSFIPQKIGDITQTNLLKIWNNSPFLKELRNPLTSKIYQKCKFFERC